MSVQSRTSQSTGSLALRRKALGAAIKPLLEMLETRSYFSVAPVADAGGPYSVQQGSSVLISGLNSTDSDGTVASYQWDTDYNSSAGFKARLTNTSGKWTFHANTAGPRQIALRVVDNNGDVSTVTTGTINVSDVVPTLSITAPAAADEGTAVNASWSYTDPGTQDVVTAWSVNWGDGTTNNYAGNITAGSHVYSEDGVYQIELTSTQANNGATTAVVQNITINNVVPLVNVSTQTPTLFEGEVAQIDFASPNRSDTLDGWSIDWGDGQQDVYAPDRSHATHIYADNGNYTATVTAQEPDGGISGQGTVDYTINNADPSASIDNAPTTGDEGTAITVGSTVTDAGSIDMQSETYGWTVYRDGQHFVLPGGTDVSSQSFTFTPTDNGSYVIRLTVLDKDGGSATIDSDPIVVANVDPAATISGTPVGNINEGDLVSLTANATDAGSEDTLSYAWSVTKDNQTYALDSSVDTSAATLNFTPDDNGSYVATVVVTDDDAGTTSVSTAAITVDNVAPTATLDTPTTANEGDTVTATPTVTDPGAADTQSYAWSVEKLTPGSGTIGNNGDGSALGELNNYQFGTAFTIVTRMQVSSAMPDGSSSQLMYGYANMFGPDIDISIAKNSGNYQLVATDINGGMASTTLGSVTPDAFFDLAITVDGTTGAVQFYIDGSAVTTSGSLSAGLDTNYHTHLIQQNSFNTLDDLSIYTSQLSSSDIASLAGGQSIGTAADDYWDFNTPGSTYVSTGTNGALIYNNALITTGGSTWSAYTLPNTVDTTGSTFSFVPTDNGTYRVKLTITDDDNGTSDSTSSDIVVSNVNPTGTVTGDEEGNEGGVLHYSVAADDAGADDVAGLTYLWSVTKDGSNYGLGGATVDADNFHFTPSDNGGYVVSVQITDKDGGTTTQTMNVTVDNVNPDAAITGAPSTSPEGTAITLGSTASDVSSDDTTAGLTYAWSVTKADDVLFALPNGTDVSSDSFTFTPTDNGSYVVSLVVSDKDGGTASISTSAIAVTNVAPTATVSGEPGTAINEGDNVGLTAAGSDVGSDDVAGLTYAWTITKDNVAWTPLDGTILDAATLAFVPTDNGSYVATVTVTDKDGDHSDTSSQPIVVNNVAPTSVITGIATPASGTVNIGLTGNTFGTVDDNGTTALNTSQPTVGRMGATPTHLIMKFAIPAGMTAASVTGATLTIDHTLGMSPASGFDLYAFASTDATVVANDLSASDPANATLITSNFAANSGNATISGTAVEDAIKSAIDAGQSTVNFALRDPDTGTFFIVENPNLAVSTTTTVTSPEGTALALGATTTDAGVADTQSYAWSVTKDGNPVDLTGITTTDASFNFTPSDNGSYVITLVTTDDDGGTSTTTATFNATNVAPAPTISSDDSVDENQPITLTAAANDPGADDASTETYLWSVTKNGQPYTLPGGTIVDAQSFTFTPDLYGSYDVSVQVTDKDGGTNTQTKTIDVIDVPPVVTITGLPTGPRGEGSPISLHGSATDVPAESSLTYSWTVTRGGQTFTLPGGTVTNGQDFTFVPTDNGLYKATLTVTDSGGAAGSSTTTNMVVTNALPDATISGAPGTPINEGDAVNLTANAADPGAEDTLSYAWTVTKNGLAYTLPNTVVTNAANFSFVPSNEGTYIATVVVTDDDGGPTTVHSSSIVVNNVAPVVNITGPTTGDEGTSISLSGVATDVGTDDVLTYAWSVTKDGQPFTLPQGTVTNGTSLSFTPTDNGSYVATLAVNDGTTTTTVNSTAIAVANVNPTGTISGPTSGFEGSPVTMTVSANDAGPDDVASLSYAWSVTKDGNSVDLTGLTTNASTFTFTPADQGAYVFSCIVSDKDNGTATLTQNVAVANVAPTVAITNAPSTGNEGTAITVGSNVSDPGTNDVLTYGWTVYKDGQHYTLPGGTVVDGQGFTFTPTDNGSYVVRLTVMDADTGSTTVNSSAITVANVAPDAAITGDTTGTEGQLVSLGSTASDVSSDDETAGLTYQWTAKLGNTTVATGTTDTFDFTPAVHGNYAITLKVTDKDGTTTTKTSTIAVDDVAPTNVTLTGTQTGIKEGDTVSLTAGASDVSGDTVSYSWQVLRDGQNVFASGTGSNVNFTAARGHYSIVIVATDTAGQTATDSFNLDVANVAPTASLTDQASTNLLASGILFGVNIGDVPAQGDMSVAWDFGDGTTASGSYTGNQLVQKKHVYTARGTYTVTATVNDGADSTVVTQQVTVAEAALLTDPADSTKTALFVTGTDADDAINVAQMSNGKYNVSLNNQLVGTNYDPTGRIYIYGNGGANTIKMTGTGNAVVFAGVKGSTVSTGSGNDVIIGTSANDSLLGGAGRDVIVGGGSGDTLRGGDGDDLIIAGGVSKMNDVASMTAVSNVWSANGSVLGRRNAVKSLFASNTLIADNGGNQIYGESGNDWFVINTAIDRVRDFTIADLVN